MLTIIEIRPGGRRPRPGEPEPPHRVLDGGVDRRAGGAGGHRLGLRGYCDLTIQDGVLTGITPKDPPPLPSLSPQRRSG